MPDLTAQTRSYQNKKKWVNLKTISRKWRWSEIVTVSTPEIRLSILSLGGQACGGHRFDTGGGIAVVIAGKVE